MAGASNSNPSVAGVQEEELTIHEVILQGDEERAKEMITADDELMLKQDERGRFPLHLAAGMGLLDLVHFMVQMQRDEAGNWNVDLTDDDNVTPLILAACEDQLEIVTYLYVLGADVNHRCADGQTALHFVSSNNLVDITNFLLACDADVNIRERSGATPLHKAAEQGYIKIVKLLVEKGKEIDIDAEDAGGSTPLQLASACKIRKVKVVTKLNRNGGEMCKNKDNQTPLDGAQPSEPWLCELLRNMLL